MQIDGGKQRLLFLTNAQAELLASGPENLAKLVNALEMTHEPKLLIVLQCDGQMRRALATSPVCPDSPPCAVAFSELAPCVPEAKRASQPLRVWQL